ncbi:hypothetical protein OL229_04275 [Neisseriaceae bacterium JH1-16]|nr:hypothetical protein [Neisseriaceae bacterium JH1-16]
MEGLIALVSKSDGWVLTLSTALILIWALIMTLEKAYGVYGLHTKERGMSNLEFMEKHSSAFKENKKLARFVERLKEHELFYSLTKIRATPEKISIFAEIFELGVVTPKNLKRVSAYIDKDQSGKIKSQTGLAEFVLIILGIALVVLMGFFAMTVNYLIPEKQDSIRVFVIVYLCLATLLFAIPTTGEVLKIKTLLSISEGLDKKSRLSGKPGLKWQAKTAIKTGWKKMVITIAVSGAIWIGGYYFAQYLKAI